MYFRTRRSLWRFGRPAMGVMLVVGNAAMMSALDLPIGEYTMVFVIG